MRRLAGLLIAFLSMGNTFLSQSEQSKETLYSFSPTLEEFAVESPCFFRELDHEQDWRVYRCNLGTRYFLITSVSDAEASQLSAIKEQAKGAIHTSESRIGDRFTGVILTRLSFGDVDGNFQNLITLKSQRRFYLFHTVSESESDEVVEGFLASIKLLSRAPEMQIKLIRKPQLILALIAAPARHEGYISRENAVRRKNPNDGRTFSVSPTQSSAFTILQRPTPAFSGLAFLYQIQGAVRLRVFFLNNAQMGDITPVERLPFGLTANAVAAARFFVFEPEVVNGVARTTSRPVSFTFNIY